MIDIPITILCLLGTFWVARGLYYLYKEWKNGGIIKYLALHSVESAYPKTTKVVAFILYAFVAILFGPFLSYQYLTLE